MLKFLFSISVNYDMMAYILPLPSCEAKAQLQS